MRPIRLSYIFILLSVVCSSNLFAKHKENKDQYVPAPDWRITGSMPHKYIMGLDKDAGMEGAAAITIKSNAATIWWGFGALAKSIKANEYRGKKIQLTGYMKSHDVKHWAGFWLRVDDSTGHKQKILSFDNMNSRAVKGTTHWTKYSIVLNVPQNATDIVYGALLNGKGQIWFEEPKIAVAGNNVPTTDVK